MKRLECLALVAAGLLVGCGGGGSDGGGGTNPPVVNLPPVVFKDVVGTAPADAGLGQPFNVQWVLPAGASISSVVLDATALSGVSPTKASCVVTAGALAASATSANITIPNACAAKTVNEVQLRITVGKHQRPDNDGDPLVRRPRGSRLHSCRSACSCRCCESRPTTPRRS